MSYSRLRSLQGLTTTNTNTNTDVERIRDNVLREVGTHTNTAQITNSGNSNVTLNSDTTARSAAASANDNDNDFNPSNGSQNSNGLDTQLLLSMLQPLLDVSRQLNNTAINNLLSNSNTDTTL